MRQTLTEIYEARIAEGHLRADPAQAAVLPVLEQLRLWLEDNPTRKMGLFAGFFAKPAPPPKGRGCAECRLLHPQRGQLPCQLRHNILPFQV